MSTYATQLNGKWVNIIDATTEQSKKIQSDTEKENFVYTLIPNSDYLMLEDKATDHFYVLAKAGSGMKQKVTCSCKYFRETGNVCEHIIAMKDVDVGKLDAADEYLLKLLSSTNWHDDENGRFVPPDKEDEVIDEKPSEPEKPAPKEKPKPETKKEKPKKEDIPPPPNDHSDAPPKPTPKKKPGTAFDWIEGLVEYGVGQIFGDTGSAKTAICREIAEQAADSGKKVVYWDSEGNMTRSQREAMAKHKNITYILDRDWDHIKSMMESDISKNAPKLRKCDLFVLDSIGVPVLGVYGTMKQNQQGAALLGMQGLLYQLTVWAEANDTVVLVTNQPVSEMNKTKEQKADRHPFGDKAMFFTKEIFKVVVSERNEYKTVCHMLAWRSRSTGRGKMLGKVTISDKGTEIEVI